MDVKLSQYKSLFIDASTKLVALYSTSLISLKENPSSKTDFDELFRSVHSLKSQCLFMGYGRMQEYCKQLETFLFPFRLGSKQLTKEVVEVLPDSQVLQNNLDSIQRSDTEIVFDSLTLPII